MSNKITALPQTKYPFIFARATEESQKLYEAGKVTELIVRDWLVVIAVPDFRVYDSRWMCDAEQGNFCLVPDVDISVEKDHIFPTYELARKFVGQWWVAEMTTDLNIQPVKTAEPEEKFFTFYWKDGSRSVLKGTTVDNAFTRGGYRNDLLKSVEWFDNGETDTHYWEPVIKNWIKRP